MEGGVEVFEEGVAGVFFGEDGGGGGNSPVNAEGFVEYGYATVGFGVVEIVTFVLEDGDVAEYCKSVGESVRYEELEVIFFRQLDGNVSAVCGGVFTDVYGDI